jgi:ribosome-binding protein aMBF1 (putative translation factor)
MNIPPNKRKHEDFRIELRKELKNPEFKREFNKLQPEFDLIQAMIDARAKKGITQKILAKRMKTKQSVISRLESGNANPSFSFVKRLAVALKTDIQVKFSAD